MSDAKPLRLSVLVTSYGRSEYLKRCLLSLLSQSRLPDEIVVVTREGDEDTLRTVRPFTAEPREKPVIRHAEVREPGVLAANRVGLPLATGDLLAFIDDDAAARPDWIARIEEHFSRRPDLGALGGRDLQHRAEGIDDRPATRVGRVSWYGQVRGFHHRRFPGVHSAEAFKGCNMAFRRNLVKGFDDAIIGNAQFYETDLCFAVRHAGFRILFDGDLVVDHYVTAPRYLAGDANPADPTKLFYIHHNMIYVMMKNLRGPRRVIFLLYTFLHDGLISALRFATGRFDGRPAAVREIFRGKLEGLRTYRLHRASRS